MSIRILWSGGMEKVGIAPGLLQLCILDFTTRLCWVVGDVVSGDFKHFCFSFFIAI